MITMRPGEQLALQVLLTAGTARADAAEMTKSTPNASLPEQAGYVVLSRMLVGPVLYGAIGWAIDQWRETSWAMPVGMVCGIALSAGLTMYRYSESRHGAIHLVSEARTALRHERILKF